jgi:putative transposase
MIRTYKYRLYPTRKQGERLTWWLDRCRELYNAALQERRDAYKMCKVSVNYYAQANQLPAIKEARPEYGEVNAQVLQNVLRRADKAYAAFFRRVKIGHKPGYPRFQGRDRYDSFTYPQWAGCMHLDNKRVTLSKLGTFKIRLHRPIQGAIKTVTIKREGEHWYVFFACEVGIPEPLPISHEEVGIDLGITHFATLSDGTFIDNPRHTRKAEKKLIVKQQSLSCCKRGSNRRKKVKQQVSRAHRKVRNQRKDFLHKESHKLVNQYGLIVFEDLQSQNMSKRAKPKQDGQGIYISNGAAAKSGLNKSIMDAGWGTFVSMTVAKAECAGRSVVFVNPAYTSQTCSGCGQICKKSLAERWHSCDCGVELDRDHNAALNILRLGSNLRDTLVVERQSPC